MLQQFAATGVGIIVISPDLPEILAASDRVVVMRNGRIQGGRPRRVHPMKQ